MRQVPVHVLVIAAVVFAYLGWMAESRWAARQMGRAADSRGATAGKPDIPPELIPDGPGVKIVQFYTGTREISRGEHAVVCYSVLNAKAVKVTPGDEDLKPSVNRCFAVKPQETTTYTLSAEGADGSTATSSFEIAVIAPPPKIEMLTISSQSIKRGEPFQMCYTVRNADKLHLEPAAVSVAPAEKRCYRWFPTQTTKYTLTAWGDRADRGRTDQLSFVLTVRPK